MLVSLFGEFLVFSIYLAGGVLGQCVLNPSVDDKDGTRRDLFKKLNALSPSLRNKAFKVDVGDHQYQLKICPDQGQTNDFSGLNQTEKNGAGLVRSVGRVNESDVFDSTFEDMLILIYTNGDDYGSACNNSERRAIIFLRPEPYAGLTEPTLYKVTEAVGMKEDFCFYMFELLIPENPPEEDRQLKELLVYRHPNSSAHHHLGVASIILIIVLLAVSMFFAVGSVYKRFAMGAQGWEQVPLIDFWRRCGSLQCAGLRYVFGRGRSRSGGRYDDYSAVSTDEERQPALDSNHNDDHLLPM